jgi:hypothetical protein
MKTLIADLKKVMNSDIENKDKYMEMLINGFLREKKTEQLPIYGVVRKSEQFKCDNGCDWYSVGHQLNGHQQCRKCGKQKAF